MTALRQRMLEDMKIRNLALNAQASYLLQVSQFARHFGKSPEVLGSEDIRAYQLHLTQEKKLAPGSITIAVSALRFLYNVTLHRTRLRVARGWVENTSGTSAMDMQPDTRRSVSRKRQRRGDGNTKPSTILRAAERRQRRVASHWMSRRLWLPWKPCGDSAWSRAFVVNHSPFLLHSLQ
jgi:Phage integrase, N-terminal SAM-like domain